MGQDTGNIVHGKFAHAAIAITGEERVAVLPDRLVGMHARAVVAKDRLGHKSRGFPMFLGHVLDNIFIPLQGIGHLDQRQEAQVNLRLAGGGHLVVVLLNPNPDLLHHLHHLSANVLIRVERRYREVAFFVPGLIAKIGSFFPAGVPDAFNRIDVIIALVRVLVETNFVKNEEFRLRPEIRHFAEPAGLDIGFGLLGDAARVARVGLTRDRVHDIAEQAERRAFVERVHDRRAGVGHDQHVRGVNRLPATNRRAVKARPVLEQVFVIFTQRYGEMLPGPDQVHELEIN